MMEIQAKWVAGVLSGKAILPSKEEMLADVEEHYHQMEDAGVPNHYTHRLPVNEVCMYIQKKNKERKSTLPYLSSLKV